MPNLARPEAFVNNLRANVESLISSHYSGQGGGFFSETSSPTREGVRAQPPPRPPPPSRARFEREPEVAEMYTRPDDSPVPPDSPRYNY